MVPFLKQVAEAYFRSERAEMIDYCFVFPNKRSGAFFRHYLLGLAGEAQEPLGLPEIATIGDLTARLVPLAEASRIDQLFILYNCYRRLRGQDIDFDRFLFWGEMILSDFNDVDLYLVDPERLFVNLKRYREVSTDYLTESQREILARYWGETFAPPSPDKFWEHLHYDSPTELERKFLKLWEVLAPLYDSFTSALTERGQATRGMMARRAVTTLRTVPTSSLRHRRYIFVGFNVLTLAELSLMENLEARGVADFYWDDASPAFRVKGNAAARFVSRNAGRFPSRYDLNADYAIPDGRFPAISLMGLPSSIGQAKVAGRRLAEWVDDGTIARPDDALDTAVVLPDDSLLIPMIHSVPPSISRLNVTMGLPMRTTSFASLINAVVSLHLRATESRGEWSYFYEDVRNVVSHPLLASLCPEGCQGILRLFAERRIYMLPAARAIEAAPSLAPLFAPIVNTDSIDEVYAYFLNLLTFLKERTTSMEGADSGVHLFFIETYLTALDDLRSAASRWQVEMKDSTFIQLLQKTIAGTTVNFTGEPLSGLQVMGVLETRALDFDNLIILSMNERIFPRKHYTRSFIPDSLRHSYGMATADFQESIYAYYFYRLISRASHVAIYYDSRNGPTFTSEMSRYVTQLLYLHPECKIEHTLGSYELVPPRKIEISIPRTPEIKEKLLTFCTPGGKPLSASAINTYVNCPLQFYLKHVCGLDTDTLAEDYMDSATYGNIVHGVVQKIYMNWRGQASSVKVTADMLDSVTRPGSELERVITETVNEHFNKLPEGDVTPLVGEAKVMGNLIKYFITRMLEIEKRYAPFDFIDAEHKITGTMTLAPDLTINIKQYLDRVDRVYPPGKYGDPMHGVIRIIDYKTGSDVMSFSELDEIFDPDKKDRPKALLQLFFYSRAYAEKFRYHGPIQPMIYKMRTLFTEGLNPIIMQKAPLEDYNEVDAEYMVRLEKLVREIVLSDTPFTRTPHEDHCGFCLFKTLCRRN